MYDFEPATRRMAELLVRVTDDQLAAPTPCEKYTLGDLIDHVGGLSQAFTAAARKELGGATDQGPSADASRLPQDWRTVVPDRLADLADAWREPDAWQGMTQAGGVDLPGEVAGIVALTEVVVHGWDVARSSGQDYDCDQATLEACQAHVSAVAASDPAELEGLFGPAVAVPADAPVLDRIAALSGRDPHWTAR